MDICRRRGCLFPVCAALGAAAVLGSPSVQADEIVLAERGKPAAHVIVVPAEPTVVVQYAAEELRDWTEKLTGVRLPIATNATPAKAIYVGGEAEEGLGPDGFRVKADGESVRVIASPVRGVLYGVYEILETYGGIGWFASWHTVIPKTGRLAVPGTLDDRQVPAFVMREPFDYDINHHPDFAARLRRNSTTWGRKLEPKHGGFAFRYGGGLEGHTYNKIVPVEKYFDAHPEWFSEIGGVRTRHRTQLCLTNPELLEVLKSNFIARVKSDPGATAYGFVQNDWYNCCDCAKCHAVNEAEGSQCGTNIRAANILAEELEKVSPGSLLKTGGYQYTQHPPKLTRPRHNVLIDLDPIHCDFSRPIPENPHPEDIAYAKDLVGWGRHAQVYVFDYVANFGNYYNPYPNIFTLQGNVKFFRDNGVKYLYEEGAYTTPHSTFSELKTWLLAKWLWNPDLPVEPLLTRFLEGFYGKGAAPFVRKYIDELHALPRDPLKNMMNISEGFGSPVYSDEFLWESLRTWNRAERAAREEGPAYVRHVRWGMMSPVTMLLQREGAAICVKRTEHPDVRIRRLAKWMVERMDEIGPEFDIKEGGAACTAELRKRWTAMADPANAFPPCDRAVGEAEKVFFVWPGFGTGVEADPKASGGKAMRIPNTFSGNWILYMPMGTFGHDAGEAYRLRVRARVDRRPGAPEGEMFEVAVNEGGKKRTFRTSADADDYRWYDYGAFTPNKNRLIYIDPGTFDRTKFAANPAYEWLWIDQVEFSRANRE